jgi:hypothetical protein
VNNVKDGVFFYSPDHNISFSARTHTWIMRCSRRVNIPVIKVKMSLYAMQAPRGRGV